MASTYQNTLNLLFPGSAPTNHYAFSEASGTNVDDTGVASLDLTTNGVVTRGNATLLPNDSTGHAAGQSKDTVLATRGDNGIFDRPATTNKLSLLAWLRPDDLRTTTNADIYTLISKGTGVYMLQITGG